MCPNFAISNGSVVRITEETRCKLHFTDGTFTRPPNGVYTHGVMVFKNVFLIKLDLEFNIGICGMVIHLELVFILSTVAGTAYEDDGSQMDVLLLLLELSAW